MGISPCTNSLFPQWLCKGHVCNCPPPGVTDIEILKEKLCDQSAPVGQKQILNITSFIITLLHCLSLCITCQKNGFWGSSPAVIVLIWGSSSISANSQYKQRATASMNSCCHTEMHCYQGDRENMFL